MLLALFVGGLISVNFGVSPTLAILTVALFIKATAPLIRLESGLLATVMQAGTFHWTGKDVEEILFRPRYLGMKPEERGFRVIFTVQSSIRLHFFGKLGKILMPYISGFQGGSSNAHKVREFTVAEFKAEMAYDKHDYDGMMLEKFFIDGIAQNDIDGTVVMQAEQKIFMDALDADTMRVFWLGDTDKVHIAAGTYPSGIAYADGDPDKYYNQIDGLLINIINNEAANPTIDQVKYIALPEDLGADDALETMKLVFDGSSKELQKLRDKKLLAYYCTDNFINNYRDTLAADGTEAARVQTIEGIERLTWNGIPLMPMDIDEHIAADFEDFPDTICILSTPQNFALVINASSSRAEVKMWFNNDENERRQRAQFKMAADFILPELVTIAHN